MSTAFAHDAAPALQGTASTYDGLYLRDNLKSQGTLPAVAPFNACPDIIQSSTPIADPQKTFGTVSSWNTIYPTSPTPGKNYYYVRGLNGSTEDFDGEISLFWTPAQLILFPSTWKNNPLLTAAGSEGVKVQAAPGFVGVGNDGFVLDTGVESLPNPNAFYSFVAQNNAAAIPTISSWLEMSQLLTQQMGIGFRNVLTFDPVNGPLLARMGFNIPMSIGESATLQLTISTQGIPAGDTIGLIGDCFTPEMKSILLQPMKTTGNSYVAGIQIDVDPGFNSSVAFQYWNTSGQVPAPGSFLTLSVNYEVPQEKYARALELGVLDSRYAQAPQTVGVGPQQIAPVGQVTYVVAASS